MTAETFADVADGCEAVHAPDLALAKGLYVVGASLPIDGRLSWYPPEDNGRYVPFNSYLLRDAGQSLLLESGVPAIYPLMERNLQRLLGQNMRIDRVAVTRNEPDCVANIPNLVRHCGLGTVHSPGLMNTLQYFRADEAELRENSFNQRSAELQMLEFGVRCVPAPASSTIKVTEDRVLDVIAVPLRVLPTIWIYDRRTKTMFCSDSFSDETTMNANIHWISDVDPHDILVRRCERNFARKFDWIARSDLTSIIANIERIFATFEVENLAPTRGVAIKGRRAVEAKIAALCAVLELYHAS